MTVICPCDDNETRLAVKAMLDYKGPVYFRTGRPAVDSVTGDIPGYSFEIGKGCQLRDGSDVTLIACGLMVQRTLKAADLLASEGISARVIDMATIKPIDREIIVKAAKETGAIVTAEEHNIIGGLGSAVSEVLTDEILVPLQRVGVNDVFGHSGHPDELLEHFGLTAENIAANAKKAIARK
jgi:transketolase